MSLHGLKTLKYNGPCLNLLRGDRVLLPVPSDYIHRPSLLYDLVVCESVIKHTITS